MTSSRITAYDIEDACTRVWAKYPTALGITIKYLYCGWYEYSIIKEAQDASKAG